MKHKALIHEALKIIQSDVSNGSYPAYGICNALESYYGGDAAAEIEEELETLMTQWPKFSGSEAYPVPDPEYAERFGRLGAAQSRFWHAGIRGRWDASTEYGRLRHELLAWLIDQTKE